MNQLNVGDKLACQIAHGAPAQGDSVLAVEFVPDLLVLTAFQEPCHAYPNQHIVSMIGPGSDEPSKFLAAGRRELRMLRTVALPFHGQERSIAQGMDRARARGPNVQRSVAPGAPSLLPGEDETRHGIDLRVAERGSRGALLLQDLVDG